MVFVVVVWLSDTMQHPEILQAYSVVLEHRYCLWYEIPSTAPLADVLLCLN